ncbi:MAG: undecaprenyl-diphosphate phosphatase [Actinomycetota bacterium]
MSVVQAIVLGVVQGLTEFVPISSSGHLVIVPAALGWDSPGLSFDVLLHVASLIALLVYFSGNLLDLVKGARAGDRDQRRLATLLLIGTIPAGLAGLLLGNLFEEQFEDARGAALQLLITAAILVAAELALRYHQRKRAEHGQDLRRMNDLGVVDAGLVGVAQAIAIVPGISRSGATIAAGLARGVSRETSARFGFLLAIPALFGAALVKLPDLGDGSVGLGAGLGGFVASLIASYVAIAALIKYLKTRSLYPFAIYCVIASVVFYQLV